MFLSHTPSLLECICIMFNMNRRYNQPIAVLIAPPIGTPIQIKDVHSSVSYQWAIYPKYDGCGRESPSGYGA